MFIKKGFSLSFSLVFVILLLSGCAGSIVNMREVPADKPVSTKPASGKSMIVFMRPATMGFGIQSSVFNVDGDTPELVGIVAAKTRVAYQVDPGKHLFMVVGESADFMSADMQADKTYYALVTPRMGVWKARFSLRPLHANEIGTPEFNEWEQACRWVEKSADSGKWANDNMPSIKKKREKYYKEWEAKYGANSVGLKPEDGK